MNQTNNIFKNSCIRGKAISQAHFWHRLKNAFKEDKTTFIILKNINFLSTALSYYLLKKYNKPCNVIIATDTRESGTWIANNFQENLTNRKHHVFNIGVAPTPFVCKAVTQYKPDSNKSFFQFGIMITASHNPAEYNGLKLFSPHGYLTEQEELEISEIFYDVKKNFINYIPDTAEAINLITSHNQPENFRALDFYLHHIKQDIQNNQFKGLKVILDCANGATYQIAQKIFESYGIQTIMVNNTPNGTNINKSSGCSNPELLVNMVQQNNADWGFAFDGDGDRIIIADKQGTIFDGDDIITILAQHPQFQNEKTLVGTIMTNEAVVQSIKKSKNFVQTNVGERNIIQALQHHNAQLGSESCGHITIMDHAPCSDGIYAALMFLDTIYSGQNINLNSYTKFIQQHDTLSLENKTISDEQITQIKNKYATLCKPGRIIIRKSNTEPVLRITVEHFDHKQTQDFLKTIKNEFINT